MKELIVGCVVENKEYVEHISYVNLYIDRDFGLLTSNLDHVKRNRDSEHHGILIQIKRTSSGDFEISKVEEF